MHRSLEEGVAFLPSKDFYDKASVVFLGGKTLKKQMITDMKRLKEN